MTLNQCLIRLTHFASFEGPFEHAVGHLALRHGHHARGSHIEAMHDALALGWAGGRNSISRPSEGSQDRGSIPAGGWMGS